MHLDNNVENFMKNSLKWNTNFITKLSKLNGLNNKNFKLNYLGMDYFLSLKGDYFDLNSIPFYKDVLKLTEEHNLSYTIIHLDMNTGDLLTNWIEGDTPNFETLNSKEFISSLCLPLKKFHSLEIGRIKNPFNIIVNMYEKCLDLNIDIPFDIAKLLEKNNFINKKYENKTHFGLCHYDLNPSNIIYNEEKISFIDLEFSAMGDVFWDLATISYMMDDENKTLLLNTYFNNDVPSSYTEKLNDYLFSVKLWNALWSLLKTVEENNTYDYRKGAEMILEELLK